jgi:hypothetical protein
LWRDLDVSSKDPLLSTQFTAIACACERDVRDLGDLSVSDGFEVPGATATVLLSAVVARVAALADRLGVPHAQVFDTGRLSVACGVPEPV